MSIAFTDIHKNVLIEFIKVLNKNISIDDMKRPELREVLKSERETNEKSIINFVNNLVTLRSKEQVKDQTAENDSDQIIITERVNRITPGAIEPAQKLTSDQKQELILKLMNEIYPSDPDKASSLSNQLNLEY